MVPNTPAFAEFIRLARSHAALSQEQLHERGGPYRQLQGWIEGADPDHADLAAGVLDSFDRAYGWPHNYTTAVAELSAYTDPTAPWMPQSPFGGVDVAVGCPVKTTTFAALYRPDSFKSPPAIGFDPATGAPVFLEGPLLTNIAFKHLRGIVNSRSGTTVVDTNIVDPESFQVLTAGEMARERSTHLYRAAPLTGFACDVEIVPIVVDPVSDLTRIEEARELAQALMKLRPGVYTTVERAAFTFLAVAAFGQDPFVTITQYLTNDITGENFRTFYKEFLDPGTGGPALASPDRIAFDLLDGLMTARISVTGVQIGPCKPGVQRRATYTAPTTIRNLVLTDSPEDNLVLYDSDVAPELPLCISHASVGAALSFYVTKPSRGGVGFTPVPDPHLLHYSIGIAHDAADRALLAAGSDHGSLGTLTNFVGGHALYCDGGRARVVWIPDL